MSRLLREKFLGLSDQTGRALVLDLVLRDDGRFLRLDYTCARLRPCPLTMTVSTFSLNRIAPCRSKSRLAQDARNADSRLLHHRLGLCLDGTLSHCEYDDLPGDD
jgi:hypothetical protein